MDRFAARLEVKFAEDAPEGSFAGYGAVFGNVDSYGDVIEPGAFADTLAQAKTSGVWPTMLAQHGGMGLDAASMMPIGIWTAMEEDAIGLKLQGQLADTARGREALALLKMQPRPAINGLSIGYRTKKFEIGTKPGEPRRKLQKVDLLEVSLVTFPANPQARITDVKSESIDAITTLSEAERFLCETGALNRKMATAFVSRLKRLSQREAAGDPEVADLLRRARQFRT